MCACAWWLLGLSGLVWRRLSPELVRIRIVDSQAQEISSSPATTCKLGSIRGLKTCSVIPILKSTQCSQTIIDGGKRLPMALKAVRNYIVKGSVPRPCLSFFYPPTPHPTPLLVFPPVRTTSFVDFILRRAES